MKSKTEERMSNAGFSMQHGDNVRNNLLLGNVVAEEISNASKTPKPRNVQFCIESFLERLSKSIGV